MDRHKQKREQRGKKHRRLRKKVSGTPERPRLCVFRSLKHIYGSIVDDETGTTLVSVSTMSSEVKKKAASCKKTDAAALVGECVAGKAKEKGIEAVVFDRGGYRFHGRVKALAEAARKVGLVF